MTLRLAIRMGTAAGVFGGLCIIIGLSTTVRAASLDWDLSRHITGPAWSWAAAQTLQASRATIRHQRFSVALAPDDVAHRLMALRAEAGFDRLQVVAGRILLSGLRGERHWLAWLERQPAGTRGWVSSLAPSLQLLPAFDAAALVPAQARRVLHFALREPGEATVSRFVLAGRGSEVAVHVRQELQRTRWRPSEPAPAAAASAWQEWQHPGGAQLAVHIQEQPRAVVALTFWHRPRGARP